MSEGNGSSARLREAVTPFRACALNVMVASCLAGPDLGNAFAQSVPPGLTAAPACERLKGEIATDRFCQWAVTEECLRYEGYLEEHARLHTQFKTDGGGVYFDDGSTYSFSGDFREIGSESCCGYCCDQWEETSSSLGTGRSVMEVEQLNETEFRLEASLEASYQHERRSSCYGDSTQSYTTWKVVFCSYDGVIDGPVGVRNTQTGDIDFACEFTNTTETSECRWSLVGTLACVAEEVVVEVETTESYEAWRPQGGVSESDPGSSIGLKAVLKRRDGSPPAVHAKRFVYDLVSVSHEPGVSMNFPKNARPGPGAPDPPADLQFVLAMQEHPSLWSGGSTQIGEDGYTKIATVEGVYTSVTARVHAFDWGAYGILRVSAELTDGRVIVGHLAGDEGRTDILLPDREDGSFIARAWKDKEAPGLSDTDDEENDPVGDGHTGDGLTLYQEYRGFHEGGAFTHIGGNPRKKDFFIQDQIGDSQGIATFIQLSGLAVHHKLRKDEIGDDRVINFNRSTGAPHRVDQHAVVLVPRPLEDASGRAVGGPGLPKDVSLIIVDHDSLGYVSIKRNGAFYLYDRTASVIAHELFHSTNVPHHGHCDKQVVWVVAEENGRLVFREDGETLDVKTESGTVVDPDPGDAKIELYLGVKGGQHSGREDCVMRYDFAHAYAAEGEHDLRYWLEEGEPPGGSLCAFAIGHDFNALERSPQSRYGSATRGECEKRICVNDAMSHSELEPCPSR